MPVFSVITPVYDGAAFVRRCYAMLSGQSFGDWEWVVVDDGSTDDTADILRSLADERIRLLSYRPNRGRGHARDTALAAAQGEWMVVWDVDDMYFPDRLEQINQARLAGYDFFGSYAVVVDNALRVKGVRGFHPAARGLARHFVHPTLACRMEVARSVGYDPGLRAGEDATMLWVLERKYRGCFFDDALTIYQEEREAGAGKALATNLSQIAQLRRIARTRLLEMTRTEYLALMARLQARRLVLSAMRLVPALYRLSIPLRSYGETVPQYRLPAWRADFLEELRRKWAAA